MRYRVEIEPYHDYVLVRMIDNPEQMTEGGIIMPNTAEKQPICQVIGFGPGRKGVEGSDPRGSLKIGDLIIMARYIGTKIEFNGSTACMVKYYDIQGTIKFVDKDTGEEFKPEIPEDWFSRDTKDKPHPLTSLIHKDRGII